VPGHRSYVAVLLDEAGELIGVGGDVRSSSIEFSKVGIPSVTFLARYWLETAGEGGEPAFTPEPAPDGSPREFLYAEFRRGRVAGTWWKESGSRTIRHPHEVTDRIAIRLE
jgi:hypothetical protein